MLPNAPRAVWFNGVAGIKVASAAAVIAPLEWYWTGGTLTIYSATSPSTTNIYVPQREWAVYGNGKSYITVNDIEGHYANNTTFYLDGSSAGWTFNRDEAAYGAVDGFGFDASSNNVTLNYALADFNLQNGIALPEGGSAHDITCNYCVSHDNGSKTVAVNGAGFVAHSATYNFNVNYSQSYNNVTMGIGGIETSQGS